ncbi:MAG TPA: ion channel [Kofleriaceae bacterium]|nr:ion channel [Kofleriaceae bacterium]
MADSDAKDKKQRPPQFFDKSGRATIERRGLPRDVSGGFAKDLYHFLRTASWTRLTIFMATLWVAVNLLFATILYVGGAEIMHAEPGAFMDRFWFSVQTMATIGYGYMVPMDSFAHAMVTIESFMGILITAMATGLFFAKFSTPNAKVLFSNVAVIADQDGQRTLMIRMANARATAIVEATARLTMTRDEFNSNGQRFRRVHDLKLRRTMTPVFALSWTIFHVIDEESPLSGVSLDDLRDSLANLLLTFTGIDDSLAQPVHTRRAYSFDDLRFDEEFVDILVDDEHGHRYMDFTCFHKTRPIKPSSAGRASAG